LENLVISRLRILTFLFIAVYLLPNSFFDDLRIWLLILFALLYSSIVYYFVAREKLQENLTLSIIDLLIVFFYLFLINQMATKFVFLIYLPAIKEILYRRIKNSLHNKFYGKSRSNSFILYS